MAAEETPLDEVMWNSPDIVQEMGYIHTDTVLPYFARSPFFDPTSNNAVIMNQATYNPDMFFIIRTREAFEAHLRSMAGLEFMVTHDPSANHTILDHSGIWVIRKQTRRKRPGQEDDVTPHSAFFVVGDRIYMAPSVGGILESRMLSTVTQLTKLLSTAATLPIFTPAAGHTYYLPKARPVVNAGKDTASNNAASKEGTPLPDSSATTTSVKAAPHLSQSNGVSSGASPAKKIIGPSGEARSLLQQSIQLTELYGREYMDTMPLQGEPGAFVLKKPSGLSRELPSKALIGSKNSTATPTPSSSGLAGSRLGAPSVPPLQIDLAEDERKRKTAAGGGSAVALEGKSPTSPGTPLTPGGTKKRKKSRVGGLAGGKITPVST